MQCINCPHLRVEEDPYAAPGCGAYEARCQEESVVHNNWNTAFNGKYLYSGTNSWRSLSRAENGEEPDISGLESVMEQLRNQKKPPKWCPLLKDLSK